MALIQADKSISVAVTLTKVLDINPSRVWAAFTVIGANYITLHLRAAGTTSAGIRLNASGGALILDRAAPWYGEVFAIADAAATILGVVEVSRG